MVWEGAGVVAGGRKLLGATKPADSAPGTIRGDFAIDVGRCDAARERECKLARTHRARRRRNICHGSDSPEAGLREAALWFPEGICSWEPTVTPWVYE